MTSSVVDSRFDRQVQMGSLAITVLIIASIWGQWRLVALVVLIELLRIALNGVAMWLIHRDADLPLESSFSRRLQDLLPVMNLTVSLLLGHVCNWTLPTLLTIPYAVLVSSSYRRLTGKGYMLLITVSSVMVMLIDAAPLLPIACYSLLALSIWAISTTRNTVLDEANAALVSKHQELAQALARLKEIQQTVLEQEKLAGLGVLAAGIAHEINNPMAFVTSNVSALARDLPSLNAQPELLREYAEDVIPATLDGIGRVNAIVHALHRFARDDATDSVEYSLNEEAQSALQIVSSQMRDRKLRVDLGGLPNLVGHPQQIVQALVNLLVNAVYASPDGGAIEVATRTEGDQAVVRVTDHGIGMSADTRSKLFQPFFTTKPVGEGTGLGLSITHGVVKAHGGSIDVSSEPGKGSTFTIRLPLRAVAEPKRPVRQP